DFVPSSVIKGLLAAIGVILILKQIPHVLGHDADPEGDMAFAQPDHQNTFSELFAVASDLHPGAAAIGLFSILLLVVWDRVKPLKKSIVPAPLVVVLVGLAVAWWFERFGVNWAIGASHSVQVPVAASLHEFLGFLRFPDWKRFADPAVYSAGVTLAIVASLETLLNLQAVDKIDPRRRSSPPSRELFAQGVGNVLCGIVGGLPVTSVIVRSSVNINAGVRTKLSTVVHGVLLATSVMFLPTLLNKIPLSSLAAILLVTGYKLASPKLVTTMWKGGAVQFIPFVVTVVAIVLTDLLIGILIGLGVSLGFILRSNQRRPLKRIVEKHLGGEVLRIELANQVSFLNRAKIESVLRELPRGSHVLIDGRSTVYIDPDVADLITEFKDVIAPAHGVQVSLIGFNHAKFEDTIEYVDYSSRELQSNITPAQVLDIFKEGNERFRSGHSLTRTSHRLISGSASGQFPLAVVLSCIDSRTPAELIFDLGLGDIFSVRVAGNVTSPAVLGSIEYGCAVAGAKLILVLGHTQCGAIRATVDLLCAETLPPVVDECTHLEGFLSEVRGSIDDDHRRRLTDLGRDDRLNQLDDVARTNVL
ncbi:MAG: bifunctional SulP family inorganic anion transporter/carbonic anhydrase, partial [Planctomycetia bacterium]